jgi:VI polysaccharide biosynthesis protein vipA/tviB
VLAVAHREFLSIPWKKIRKTHSVIYDVKGILPDADKYL